jgi:cytochrome P450/pimeloyl-ACP methyl ester carboxylesterase
VITQRVEILETTRGPVDILRFGPETGIPVVLCGGLVGSKEDFAPIAPALAAAGYRLHAYDYRGHYAPEPVGGEPQTLERHATDLLAVLDAVDGHQPVHVVGHSFGGFVARAAAVTRPDRFRSVSLIGSGPSFESERHRIVLSTFDATLRKQGCAVMWPVIRRIIPSTDHERRRFWQLRLDRMRLPFLHGALHALGAEPDRGAELRATKTPVLVVHGIRDRRLWSAADLAAYAERAGGDVAVITDASHSPNLEQPAATAAALLNFWRPVDRHRATRTCLELLRPKAVSNPYPSYKTLPDALAVDLPGRTPMVVLTRYADCARVLLDAAFVGPGEAPDQVAPRWREEPLIRCLYQSFGFREGPPHMATRRAVAQRLTARRCETLREDVERLADELLDGLPAQCDLVEDLALPFAALTAGRLLDLPDDEALRLGRLTRDVSAAFEPFMTPRQRTRMASSGDALVASLRQGSGLLATVRGDRDGGDEGYHGDLVLLFGAGFDSSASLISLGAKLLLEHPAQAEILRSHDNAVRTAVEEILRFDPPVQLAVRVSTSSTRIGDIDVDEGTPILALIGAANRDPDYVDDPDRFLVTRKPTRPSLAFGLGRRYCPGAALARLQAEVLFPRLLRRFPGLRPAGPPTYRAPGTMLRGLETLPVVLEEPCASSSR